MKLNELNDYLISTEFFNEFYETQNIVGSTSGLYDYEDIETINKITKEYISSNKKPYSTFKIMELVNDFNDAITFKNAVKNVIEKTFKLNSFLLMSKNDNLDIKIEDVFSSINIREFDDIVYEVYGEDEYSCFEIERPVIEFIKINNLFCIDDFGLFAYHTPMNSKIFINYPLKPVFNNTSETKIYQLGGAFIVELS